MWYKAIRTSRQEVCTHVSTYSIMGHIDKLLWLPLQFLSISSKIYFAPYGVGLGHASRLVTIASYLGKDYLSRFSSYGEAVPYIRMRGYDCSSVPPVEFVWSGESGFSVKKSLAQLPLWLSNFSKQMLLETKIMSKFVPNVVVSDSRLSPLLSAKILSMPSIVILNQIKLLLSPRLRQFWGARVFEKLTGEFMGLFWSNADRILDPDLPPPYTISEHNIWDCDVTSKKIEYVGFVVPLNIIHLDDLTKVANDVGLDRSKPIIFIHISGPKQTRLSLLSTIIESAKSMNQIQWIASEGRPEGSTSPVRLAPNILYYEWCPIKDELFSLSDLVIIRGGHTVISQAIMYGKPMITIPIQNHGEQLGNSEKVEKLKIGIKLDPNNIGKEQIVEAVNAALNTHQYVDNSQKLKSVADKFNGIEKISEIIRQYL
jgi:UDP-N-acetylglucosamine--N-acetylmuramyl-(pentapeptide) pyrophosphoryl-undecaprenol N-acetylglucosamine transferase